MDASLADLDLKSPLPYEDLAPPSIFTSVLRQLWGVVRGGSASVLAEGSSASALAEGSLEEERSTTGEEDNVVVGSTTGEEEDEMEATVAQGQGQYEMEATVARLDPGQPVPIGRLEPSAKSWCPTPTMATDVTSAQRMKAVMLNIQLGDDDEEVGEGANEVEHCWQFEFGDRLGGDEFGIGRGANS